MIFCATLPRHPPAENVGRAPLDFFEKIDRLPEAVASALVVGIKQNHSQMKALDKCFHLAVVLLDSDH